MKRLSFLSIVSIAVACAVSSITLVVAQDQKAAVPKDAVSTKVYAPQDPMRAAKEAPAKPEDVKKAAAAKLTTKEAADRRKAVEEKVAAQRAAVQKAQEQAIVGQYTPIFQSILRSEFAFVRNICQPTKEQREALKSQGDQLVADAVKQFSDQRGRVQVLRVNNTLGDPRTSLEVAVTAKLKGILTPEQWDRYQDEIKKRSADRKQTTIDNLVARMDQDLCLSADQREKLCEAFAKNWEDSWFQALDILTLYGDQYFPQLPDKFIMPILDPRQKTIWAGIQKIQIQYFFGIRNQFAVDGDPWDDDEAADARKDAPKQEKKPSGAKP